MLIDYAYLSFPSVHQKLAPHLNYIEHRPAKPQLIEPQWAFASAGPQSWLIQCDRPLGQLGQGHPLRPSGYRIQQGQDAIPR